MRRTYLAATIASVALVGVLVFFAIQDRQPISKAPESETSLVKNDGEISEVPPVSPSGFDRNWDDVSRAVVRIEAGGVRCGQQGSGTIILDGSYVLTNQHVSGEGECDLRVWLTDSTSVAPTRSVSADVVLADAALDLAVIRMLDQSGSPFIDPSRTPVSLKGKTPDLGEKLYLLGYPGSGGSTITFTSGDFAGMDVTEDAKYFKTTASMNPGVSGGAALDRNGFLVGIPTAGVGPDVVCRQQGECVANGSTIGLLRPATYAEGLIAKINDG